MGRPKNTVPGTATMRVYHLVRPGELRLEEVEIPQPGDGEVLASVSVALTCGTDLKTFQQGHARLKVPSVLGHEWAGRVGVLGPGVGAFAVGDRIVTTPTAPCGDCVYCLSGRDNLCLHLFEDMALGAYGEYLLIPRHIVNRNAFAIPDQVSDVQAAFLEPLACVVHGSDLVQIAGDRTLLFLGDGPISLLFMQVARLRGAGRILLLGRNASRLEIARRMGFEFIVNARQTDPSRAVEVLTDGLGVDTVVECVGRPEAWAEAVGYARRGGEVLFFGGCEKGTAVTVDTERLHYDELALKGGFHYTPDTVRRAWDLICSGTLDLDALVTHREQLEELPSAFERVLRREAIKVAIVP